MPAESSLAERLRVKLLDRELTLPQRFRVLFSLRGLAGKDAVDALLAGGSREQIYAFCRAYSGVAELKRAREAKAEVVGSRRAR